MGVRRRVAVRWVPARFLPLTLACVTVPLLPRPTTADWLLALASALLTIAGGRFPLPVLLAQSALLAVGAGVQPELGGAGYLVQFLAAFALVEVLMRELPRWRALPVFPFAAVTGWHLWVLTGDVARTLAGTVILTAAACALGVHLWSLRLWMRRYHEQLREVERLREAETTSMRAAERAAIARELHDLLAHHVASIVLRVGVARHAAPGLAPELAEVLADVHGTGTSALAELRELLHVLRDPANVHDDPGLPLLDPKDLLTALEEVVDRIRRAGLPVRAEIDPAAAELGALRRLAVLRIAQEGLTNSLRHAVEPVGATLRVEVGVADTRVEVTDDGRPAPAGADHGHGLTGLAERVRAIGGDFTAAPAATGWRLLATLPAANGTGEAG